jgi:hypothetical protein
MQFGRGGLPAPAQVQHKNYRKFTFRIGTRQLSELMVIFLFPTGRKRGRAAHHCGGADGAVPVSSSSTAATSGSTRTWSTAHHFHLT